MCQAASCGIVEVVLRQLDSGQGFPGGVDVAQQGQDGVVVRGRRYLDLAAGAGLLVQREDFLQELPLDLQQLPLVLLGEVPALPDERLDLRLRLEVVAAPGEVEPDLEVAQVALGEVPRLLLQDLHVADVAPLLEEFLVAGIRLDHVVEVEGEEILQQEDPVLQLELAGGLAGQLQETVRGVVFGVIEDLFHQRGHEIEGGVHVRELLEHGDHVVVVLQGVQPDPRQQVFRLVQLLVQRLVHVPQHEHVQGIVALCLYFHPCHIQTPCRVNNE